MSLNESSSNVTNLSDKEGEILKAIRAVKFGTIVVVINNSEIVQLESTTKKRFDSVILKQKNI